MVFRRPAPARRSLGWVAALALLPLAPARAADLPAWLLSEPLGGAEGLATTTSGGQTFDLATFLGANRYYGHATPITGQNTITTVIDAGLVWNGHETLQHVSNFAYSADTFGDGVAPLVDRHPTWVAQLIGGRPTPGGNSVLQSGLAPGTDLRSAALATSWVGSSYSTGFNLSLDSLLTAFDASFGTAQVINSSWGSPDPGGSGFVAFIADSLAYANPRSLHVISAGNSGPGANTLGAPASGYNGLAVGALSGPNSYGSLASFSSRGPQDFSFFTSGVTVTVPGVRAAVDLVAPGSGLVSAFYGGQTGGNNPGLAGSSNQGTAANAYSTGGIQGTSFAAPLVSAGASLVASAARTLTGLFSDVAAATTAVVNKALLLTGASKPSGWTNGLTSQVLGGGTVLSTSQGLDWGLGAGLLNLANTYGIQLLGQRDVAGTGQGLLGNVASLGWDYGLAQRQVNNDYRIAAPLLGGSTFTATLSFQRPRQLLRTGGSLSGLEFAQADLDLQLWRLDDLGNFSALVAQSVSDFNTSEHFSFALPSTGRYGLRVAYGANTFDNTSGSVWGTPGNLQAYGLAWSGTAVVPGPLPLLGVGAAYGWSRRLRRRRRGSCSAPADRCGRR